MGLTFENAPRYTAFTTVEKLTELRARGAMFFGLFVDAIQVSFMALEKEEDGDFALKRLAVLPEYRHAGYGWEMVDYAIACVKNLGGEKIKIGIVDEQTVLKDWYSAMDFRELSVRQFEGLPFRVCFMEMDII